MHCPILLFKYHVLDMLNKSCDYNSVLDFALE